MPDAFIYDHVRTPRGRGKVDGSLHEVTALNLASQALRAIKERNQLDTALVDDVVMGVVDPVGEAAADIARTAALVAGYGNEVPGVQINRFCASGLDAVNFAAAQIMSGQQHMAVGGGVESMSRVGIGAAGGAWAVDPSIAVAHYFLPQGISADLIATKYGFSRDDVDAYAVESQKRAAAAWEEGRFNHSVDGGEGRQWPDHSGQGRAHAAGDDHAVAGRAEAVLRADGRTGRLRCRRHPGAPGSGIRQSRPSRRQFLRHRRRRRGGSGRQQGRRRKGRAEAARARARLRQYRLRSGADADRPDRRHQESAQDRRHDARRHRSHRDQRGLRRGGVALSAGLRSRYRPRSTSTAAPSRSAIRSAPPAR